MNNISQEIEGIYTSNSRNGTYSFVISVHIKISSFLDSGTVHNAPFHMKNGAKLFRFGLTFTLLGCENGAFRKLQ